jgi:hypothetical protein
MHCARTAGTDATTTTTTKKNESPEPKPVVLGKKAKVLANKLEKQAKSRNLINKFNKAQDKKKATKVYDVHDQMSVRDLARITGAPLDILFDLVLGLVSPLFGLPLLINKLFDLFRKSVTSEPKTIHCKAIKFSR